MNVGEPLIDTLLAILLPIAFGTLLKRTRLFRETEVAALRKFVMRVALPFLIFQNLYHADTASLGQALPIVCSFALLTALYTLAALLVAPLAAGQTRQRQTFAFAVFAGNYAFLGWGMVVSFLGAAALTRAVFFSMFFWPVFLVCGLTMRHLDRGSRSGGEPGLLTVLVRHAGLPISVAFFALTLNLAGVALPRAVNGFVAQFAALAIPLILFAIGQNLSLWMPLPRLRLVLGASLFRLVGGWGLGLLVVWLVRLVFPLDRLSQQVILLQAAMPTATMATFFSEYVELDEELLSGIITFSTLLSFLTLPVWVVLIRRLVPG